MSPIDPTPNRPATQPKYAVDVSKIDEGHVFEVDEVVRLINTSPRSRNYPRDANAFAKWLEHKLWGVGKKFTVRFEKDTIKVLTRNESFEYNKVHFTGYIDRAGVRATHFKAIDASWFDYQKQQDHARLVEFHAAVLKAVRGVRKTFIRDHETNRPESST